MFLIAWALLLLLQCTESSARNRVAIIGAGMAGAHVVDRLRQMHGSDLKIDMYEADNRTGGRAFDFEFEGQVSLLVFEGLVRHPEQVKRSPLNPEILPNCPASHQILELGASIIWDKNLYMAESAKRMGLRAKSPSEGGEDGFSVYNGHRFVFNQVGGFEVDFYHLHRFV